MQPGYSSKQLVAEMRAEIARQRIPQATIAQTAGLTRASLSRKLRDRQALTLSEAVAIAGVLGVPLSELFRRAEQATAA